jgi:uncharacterized protein
MADEVLGEIAKKIQKKAHEHNVEFLAIFGSFANGTEKPKSDLDILVRFAKSKSLWDLVHIKNELSEASGRKVDLVTEAALSPYIRESVKSSMKVIYGKAK